MVRLTVAKDARKPLYGRLAAILAGSVIAGVSLAYDPVILLGFLAGLAIVIAP